jgi:hypothetical protein
MADLTGLVPNFGKPPTPTIKQQLIELKQRAEIKHAYWKPTAGDTIVGEVLAYDQPLIIKTEDDQIIKIYFGSIDTPVTNRDGDYLVEKGSLIAVTYNGVNPPRGVKEYSVLIERMAR